MVEIYGVGFENVAAVGHRGVDIFVVSTTGVDRSVMVIANDEGDCVGSRRLNAASSALHVMGESHLCVEVKVEATAPDASI